MGDAQLLGQFVQCLALNDFTSGIGEESLSLFFFFFLYDITYHGIEDSIAEKLQTLVVERFSFFTLHDAFVHQGEFVVMDVFRIESQYVVESRIKLLLLQERELYPVDEIIQHIF